MNPKCKVCGTPMPLRDGKFGPFYFCPRSKGFVKHGTITKAAYDAQLTAGLAKVYKRDTEDQQMVDHFKRVEAAGAGSLSSSVIDFYVDHSLSSDESDPEWDNILPLG
jgi:hypothetical protein